VQDAARDVDEGAGLALERAAADQHPVGAVQDIERLGAVAMDVQRRPGADFRLGRLDE
jgi:hypothetical protein